MTLPLPVQEPDVPPFVPSLQWIIGRQARPRTKERDHFGRQNLAPALPRGRRRVRPMSMDPRVFDFAARHDCTAEVAVLLELARGDAGAAAARLGRVDPAVLLDVARLNKLLYLLWRERPLLKAALPGLLPPLDRFRLRTIAINRLCLRESVRLGAALRHEGVAHVQFKGPLQQLALHGDAFLKPAADIDILVHAADRPRAARLLEAAGYRPQEAALSAWWTGHLGEEHYERPRAGAGDREGDGPSDGPDDRPGDGTGHGRGDRSGEGLNDRPGDGPGDGPGAGPGDGRNAGAMPGEGRGAGAGAGGAAGTGAGRGRGARGAAGGLDGPVVDLHHRLQQPGSPGLRAEGRFVDEAVALTVKGEAVPIPSPPHVCLVIAANLGKGIVARDPCLSHVLDLRAALARLGSAEAEGLAALAQAHGMAGTLGLALHAVDVLCPLPGGPHRPPGGFPLAPLPDATLTAMIARPWDPRIAWPRRRRILWALCGGAPLRFLREVRRALHSDLHRRALEARARRAAAR